MHKVFRINLGLFAVWRVYSNGGVMKILCKVVNKFNLLMGPVLTAVIRLFIKCPGKVLSAS